MVHDGVMAITDPTCLEGNDQPGCNLFGLPDCRACALVTEAVADNVPPCELLDLESEAFGDVPVKEGDCIDCEPLVPPPLQPRESAHPPESSEEEDYVPIVIVLPTDIFIETESSDWSDSEESDNGEGTAAATRRLRTQL
ncbi:hypothetical protein PRIC1_004771 [Phytophthora ramorum]